jgi:hypothetical protein
LNFRAITTAVTFLSISFTTHQTTRISSQTAQTSNDYDIFIYCLWVWWSLVVGYCSRKTRPYVLNKIYAGSWTKFWLLLASERNLLVDWR